MGSKPSNIYAADRPESGGADRKQEREHTGLLDLAKREFTQEEKAKVMAPAQRVPTRVAKGDRGANARGPHGGVKRSGRKRK